MHSYTPPLVQQVLSELLYNKREERWSHVSYLQEMQMLTHIRDGNVEALSLHSGLFPQHDEHLSRDRLRQAKYQGVAAIALISRWSLGGGLDGETAYSLSDAYIMAIDMLDNVQDVRKLIEAAPVDFANRVLEHRQRAMYSTPVFRCIEYIETNLHDPITLQELSEASGRSAAYISVLFKKEVGVSFKQYLLSKRLEEARRLLTSTELPVSNIASTLAFETQSYFSRVFRRQTGLAPLEYRRDHCRAEFPPLPEDFGG